MKLKDYAKLVAQAAKKYPDLDVYIASDEEGNNYNEVCNPCFLRVKMEDREIQFSEIECQDPRG